MYLLKLNTLLPHARGVISPVLRVSCICARVHATQSYSLPPPPPAPLLPRLIREYGSCKYIATILVQRAMDQQHNLELSLYHLFVNSRERSVLSLGIQ